MIRLVRAAERFRAVLAELPTAVSQRDGASIRIVFDANPHLAHLVISNPGKRNAISGPMILDLADAVIFVYFL